MEENPGLVPDPAWKLQTKGEGWAPGDTVNLGIGQGELQVTPLQLAVMLAAVGNGGTLYRPQVVEMIAADPAHPDVTFQPVVAGQLPISADNLAVIRDSLTKVAMAEYGTAYAAFKGLSMPGGRQDRHRRERPGPASRLVRRLCAGRRSADRHRGRRRAQRRGRRVCRAAVSQGCRSLLRRPPPAHACACGYGCALERVMHFRPVDNARP